jgi:hypothetical protein
MLLMLPYFVWNSSPDGSASCRNDAYSLDISPTKAGFFRYVVWLLSEPVAILTWGERASLADAARAAEEATRSHQSGRPSHGS